MVRERRQEKEEENKKKREKKKEKKKETNVETCPSILVLLSRLESGTNMARGCCVR
jgi:hypothetical protein